LIPVKESASQGSLEFIFIVDRGNCSFEKPENRKSLDYGIVSLLRACLKNKLILQLEQGLTHLNCNSNLTV
jgi:hypothetical protein